MKNNLYIIFILLKILNVSPLAFSQTILTKETHALRIGDVIQKYESEYKSPGRNGRDVIWDFSDLSLKSISYEEGYDNYCDSLILHYAPRFKNKYYFNSDSLFCVGYETESSYIDYSHPKLLMKYPFVLGDSICSYFYGNGKYSNLLNLTSFGFSKTIFDATGVIILPNNDTLYNVIRSHEFENVGQIISAPSHQQYNALQFGHSSDSILYHLNNDSISWRLNIYKWYTDGYRYPIFETVKTEILHYNRVYDHFNRSYYYPITEQDCYSDNDIGDESRWRQQINEKQNIQSCKSNNNSNISYNFYMDNNRILSFEIFSQINSLIEISLCTVSGYSLLYNSQQINNYSIHKQSIDLSSYPSGVYILTLVHDGNTYVEKIVKEK